MSTTRRKRLLFDWHIPGFLDEVRLDVPAYLRAMEHIQPDRVVLMGKSAFGCTYYDDAHGYRNHALGQDIFAELVGPLHERGIEAVAYFNITLNDVVAAEHPQWHQVDPDGQPVIAFEYHQLCMNSPYRDLLLTMMTDLASKYPVDSFWFDLQYVHANGCFCDSCRRGFREETGVELTADVADDPEMNYRFHEFRRNTRGRFILDAVRQLREIRPELRFGWNHAGDIRFSERETDRAADWLSVEFHPPGFAGGGFNARALRGQGTPFELMLPESIDSWGDWTVMTPVTMRTMVAIAAAHGGAPIVGHVAYPSGDYAGRLATPVVQTIADAFAFVDERERFCQGARSVPIGACLHSVENWRAAQASEGLPQVPSAYRALRGAAEMLADNNIHFDIIPENALEGLGEYEFVVLPDIGYISDDTAAALRRYVRNGGCMIAAGRTSLADRFGRPQPPSLTDLLGVESTKDSPYSVIYLELSQKALSAGVPEMPLLVNARAYGQTSSPTGAQREHSLRCQASDDTNVWATFAEPCLEPDFPAGRHIYHAHSPPDHRSQWPAILHRRVGSGRVLYIAAPLFRAYAISHSPSLRRMLANALGVLGLPRAFGVDGPAGVETVLNEQDGRWLVHLIPRRTESVESSQVAEGSAIHGVAIRVRKPGARSVRLEPAGRDLECHIEGDLLTVQVPPFHEWTILSIQ